MGTRIFLRGAPPGLVAAAVVAPLCAFGLSACSAGGQPDTITLYNGQHAQTTAALVSAFERQSGINVRVHSDDESVLADQIVTEGPRSPADVIFTENTPALQYLDDHHLLARLPSSVFATTTARFDAPGRSWVGISARVSVLVYNPSRIKPADLPTSVLELADHRYQGLLALAPGETDFQPIVTAVLRAEGRAATLRWLEGMKANAGNHLYPDNETVVAEVNAGQVGLGVINQYYWYRLRAEIGAPAMRCAISTFRPRDPGYVVDVSGAGVLSSSSHRADAVKFVKFLTSATAQRIIASGDSFEYPIDAGVTTAAHETPFDALRPDPVSPAQLGDGAAAVALLQEVQLL
jgi:iron(III) transport system substrate-binding protein